MKREPGPIVFKRLAFLCELIFCNCTVKLRWFFCPLINKDSTFDAFFFFSLFHFLPLIPVNVGAPRRLSSCRQPRWNKDILLGGCRSLDMSCSSASGALAADLRMSSSRRRWQPRRPRFTCHPVLFGANVSGGRVT